MSLPPEDVMDSRLSGSEPAGGEAQTADGPRPTDEDDLILCTDHMRRFNPKREDGCPRCLGVEPQAPVETRPPWAKLAVAAVVIVAIGSLFVSGVSGSSTPAAREVAQMKAGPFSGPIKDMEWILYAAKSEGMSDAREIERQARRLADGMKEWESRLHMTPYITLVRDYADWVHERSREGFDDAALAGARREWERVRAKVFEPEDWFLSW